MERMVRGFENRGTTFWIKTAWPYCVRIDVASHCKPALNLLTSARGGVIKVAIEP